MKTLQDFSPYNGLNCSRSKRQFQCKLQTVQRALNENTKYINIHFTRKVIQIINNTFLHTIKINTIKQLNNNPLLTLGNGLCLDYPEFLGRE